MSKYDNPIGWNKSSIPYSKSGKVELQNGCFAFMVTNVGDAIVSVDGELLFPSPTPTTEAGDSISFGDPKGKVFMGLSTNLNFTAGGVNPLAIVTQLFYLYDKYTTKP